MLHLLFIFFIISLAQYHDSTCNKLKCTRDEMALVDRAKFLTIGNHTCKVVVIFFNLDGSYNNNLEFPAIANTFYDPNTGSLHTDFVSAFGTYVIDEYCDSKGGACITVDDPIIEKYYVRSKDQVYGDIGTAWRAIGFYTKGSNKRTKRIQSLLPTNFGDVLTVSQYSDAGNIETLQVHTCNKI